MRIIRVNKKGSVTNANHSRLKIYWQDRGRSVVAGGVAGAHTFQESTGTHTFQEADISPSDIGEIFDKFSNTPGGTSA